MKNVKVEQQPGMPEVPMVVMAQQIRDLSEAAKKMMSAGLSERAICVLLKDMTGVPMETSRLILRALPELAKQYCVKK